MMWRGRRVSAEAAIITAVSGYEFFSLVSGITPPITHLIRPLPKPVKASIVAFITGWSALHFEVIILRRALEEARV